MTIYWCDPDTSNSLLILFLLIIDCLCFARLQKGNWTQGVCFGWTVWRLEDSCGDNIGQTLWRVSNRACSTIHLGAGDQDTDPLKWLRNVNWSSASCLVCKRISPRDEDEVDSKPCEGLRLLCQLWLRNVGKGEQGGKYPKIKRYPSMCLSLTIVALQCFDLFCFPASKQYTLPEGSVKDMNEF